MVFIKKYKNAKFITLQYDDLQRLNKTLEKLCSLEDVEVIDIQFNTIGMLQIDYLAYVTYKGNLDSKYIRI